MKLTDRKWNKFKIADLFTLDRNKKQVPTGAYINKTFLQLGQTPRITVTAMNNGIDNYYFTTHKNNREFNNFISISFLGNAFYHQYTASIDMKVHALLLKNIVLNKYLALFLVNALNNNAKNSSYGNQLSSTDLPRKDILLPINEQGQPDYEFMEAYIKEIMTRKRQEYINYANGQLGKIQEGRKEGRKERVNPFAK